MRWRIGNNIGKLGWLILLFVSTINQVAGQSVIGVVMEEESLTPLPYAHIFINNTSIGTSSDISGKFTLTGISPGKHELVASYLGYNNFKRVIEIKHDETLSIEIRLSPSQQTLNEVQIVDKRDRSWLKQLKKFHTIFLGTSSFARDCKIINPWVLEFNEDSDRRGYFLATAIEPLIIENIALGYRMTYHLKHLVSTDRTFNIQGEISFDEMKTSNTNTLDIWRRNRKVAYEGTYRHLFTSLIKGNSREEGFIIYNHSAETSLVGRQFQSNTFASLLNNSIHEYPPPQAEQGINSTTYRINFPKNVEVHYIKSYAANKVYKDINCPVSWLSVDGGILEVNHNGVLLNPGKLVVSGVMYDFRVANLLPENYTPDDERPGNNEFNIDKAKRLQEWVHLFTDRPYYHPGDRIWIKASLLYALPERMDTLSRVLYVELINRDKAVIETKVLRIAAGAASGHILIPRNAYPGEYYLRGYTNWTLNFGTDNLQYLIIPILSFDERPSKPVFEKADTNQIRIIPDKMVYAHREKVNIILQHNGPNEHWSTADLAVSVTDIQQVIETGFENNQLIEWHVNNDPAIKFPFIFPIESGISFQGKLLSNRGLPKRAELMVTESKENGTLLLESEDNGLFWITGLQHDDSVRLDFRYANKKEKSDGKIMKTPRVVPFIKDLPTKPLFPVIKSNSININYPIDTTKAVLLDNVVIESKRLEPTPAHTISRVYGKSDVGIDGQSLARSSTTSLVDGLRGRVAGFNVVWDAGSYYIRIGPISSLTKASNSEPLLIVDGQQFPPGTARSVYDELNEIRPDIVDRVEIIKYGGGAIYGLRGGNGVYTKGGNFRVDAPTKQITSSTQVIGSFWVAGYSQIENPIFPEYSHQNATDQTLDVRKTLYWNPSVLLDASGKTSFSFYTSDVSTTLRISVVGKIDNRLIGGIIYIKVQ